MYFYVKQSDYLYNILIKILKLNLRAMNPQQNPKTGRLVVERPVSVEEKNLDRLKDLLHLSLGQKLNEQQKDAIRALLNQSVSYHTLTDSIFAIIVESAQKGILNQPSNRWKAVEDVTPPPE